MSMHTNLEELLRQAEKLLREADAVLNNAYPGDVRRARKVRTAINAACNALHRATRA